VTFFCDNNIAVQIPRVLRALDADAYHLSEVFPEQRNKPDEEWIPYIAEREWALITADKTIRRDPEQRALLIRSCITTFFIEKAIFCLAPVEEQCIWFIRHWRRLLEAAERAPRGTHYRVSKKPDLQKLSDY